jgi:hypothetical protein
MTAWIGSLPGLKSEIPFDLAQGRLSTSSGQALGHPAMAMAGGALGAAC